MRWAVSILLFALCAPAQAAWPTRVLTAFEPDDPFDVDVGVRFIHSQSSTLITREHAQGDDFLDVRELEYRSAKDELELDFGVALYRDFDLRITVPFVVQERVRIAFADGVAGNSTLCCAGEPNADDPSIEISPRYPILAVPTGDIDSVQTQRRRAGVRDPKIGLGWAPIVQRKSRYAPDLLIRLDATLPITPVRTPQDIGTSLGREAGAVGEGVFALDFQLGVSRRIQLGVPAIEPFLVLDAYLPVKTVALDELGYEPPYRGGFTIGADVIMHEEAEQRYALELSFRTQFVGPGRTFTELSDFLPAFDATRPDDTRGTASTVHPDNYVYDDFDTVDNYTFGGDGGSCGKLLGVPCGELSQIERYTALEGALALHLEFSEFAFIRTGVKVKHRTDHFITNERVGVDLDPQEALSTSCDGVACVDKVNARNSFFDRDTNTCPAGQVCDERNPYFDPRYDAIGKRLRAEGSLDWTIFLSAAATF